jgi:glycerol kinase
MLLENCILSVDQVTTSSRARVFAADSSIIAAVRQESNQHYLNDIQSEHNPLVSENKLLTTVTYTIKDKTLCTLKASIFIAGAAVQWLRDSLNIIENAFATEATANNILDEHGVFLVPAFARLGTIYWAPDNREAVFGLTRSTSSSSAHLARARLKLVCMQTSDLFKAMRENGVSLEKSRIDSGLVPNVTVERPNIVRAKVLGISCLDSLHVGNYQSADELVSINQVDSTTNFRMDATKREKLLTDRASTAQSTLGFTL